MTEKQSMPRTLIGTVVSDKMNQGIVVLVERQEKHPKYKKYIRRSTKVHAHDEKNSSKVGDVVIVKECPPVSKTKCWTLVEIKERTESGDKS